MVQLDGVGSGKGRLLAIGATNRPYDLDEAALRRMTKRIYIGLPDAESRLGQMMHMLQRVDYSISEKEMGWLIDLSHGYSSADLSAVVKEAAMAPLRDLPPGKSILDIQKSDLRKVLFSDFQAAFSVMKPSVSPENIQSFTDWHDKIQNIK